MRYRRLDANGDYSFGHGQADFLINQPEAVAQYVLTRLMLWQGQWFYNLDDGTPWMTQVLGERTQATRDIVVQERVNTTPGVTDMSAYYSRVDPNTRTFSAAMTVDTVYGVAQPVSIPGLPATIPPLPPVIGGGTGAALLGIAGGLTPLTGTVMEPADLLQSGQQDITEFAVTNVDGGRY